MKVAFKPLKEEHLPILRKWLKEPHVAEFWQETEDENEFREKFLNALPKRGVSPFIIILDATPIGYIQHYEARSIGGGWWPDTKEGTFGIDQFIGDPAMINRGYGTAIIRQFVENLFQNPSVKEIITDPDPKNHRAIRAYEKVGFLRSGEIKTPGGDALLLCLGRPDCQLPMMPSKETFAHATERIYLKKIGDEQEEFMNLQTVLEAAPNFSHRTTGVHPDASAAQSMITALPPNKDYKDKFVFNVYRNKMPVGCVDLIRGYPDNETAWIGLLLIDERLHGQGLGRAAYEKTERQIRSWSEIRRIGISVVKTNDVAIPFWQKMGFSLTGERKPYKDGTVESELILLRKALA